MADRPATRALAFFAADVLMNSIGWRAGAPGAARLALLTVAFGGSLAAALVSGAARGFTLHQTAPGWETSNR